MTKPLVPLLAFIVLASVAGGAAAQTQPSPAPAPAPAPAAAPSQPMLKAEELDQITAPIALYPDALLAHVLMASTYPLEVIEADLWAKAYKSL